MIITKYFDGSWYDFAFSKMQENLTQKEKAYLFDIGAGNSVLKNKVEEIGLSWIGFDYEPREEYIIKWNLDNPLEKKDLPPPDCIFMLEVIEHLLNPGNAIKHISEVSKKGTLLVMSTPNPFWSVIRIKFFLKGVFPMFDASDLYNNHHVFTVWPHVLEFLLKQNGFEIIDSSTISYKAKFPAKIGLLYPVRIIYYFLRKFIEAVDKRSKGMSYGLVARKL